MSLQDSLPLSSKAHSMKCKVYFLLTNPICPQPCSALSWWAPQGLELCSSAACPLLDREVPLGTSPSWTRSHHTGRQNGGRRNFPIQDREPQEAGG